MEDTLLRGVHNLPLRAAHLICFCILLRIDVSVSIRTSSKGLLDEKPNEKAKDHPDKRAAEEALISWPLSLALPELV
jgi:hypothetical protein